MSRFFRRKVPAPTANMLPGPGKLETLPEAEEEQLPRTLLPAPSKPKFRMAIVQSSEQADTIVLANGIVRASTQAQNKSSAVAQRTGTSGKERKNSKQAAVNAPNNSANGCAVDVLTWLPEDDEAAHDVMTVQLLSRGYDAVVARVQEAHFNGATESWTKLRQVLRRVSSLGTPVWPTPQVETAMASKDIVVQLKSALPQMSLPDTFAYFSSLEVERGLKTTLAAGPRVVRKSSRNNDSGASSTAHEGAWLVALASGNYCEKLGDATLVDSDLVYCIAMSNGHEVAPRPLKELVAFLCYGRNQKGAGDSWGYAPNGQLNQGGYLLTNAGTHINGSEKGNNSDANGSNSGNSSSASGNSSGDATSSSNGLFSGGVEGGSGVVDMRLLPETRTRGTVQFLMAGTKVVRISHTTPRPPPGKRSPTADVLGAYAEGSSSVRGYGEDDETKFEGLDVEEFQDVEDDKHGIGTVHETLLRSEKAKTARRTLRYMFAEWGWVEARRAPTNQMLRFADLPIGTSGGAGDGTFTHLRKTVEASVPSIVAALLGHSPVDTATSSSSGSTFGRKPLAATTAATTKGNKTNVKAGSKTSSDSTGSSTYGNYDPVTFAAPSMTAAANALYASVGQEETSSPNKGKDKNNNYSNSNASGSRLNVSTAAAAAEKAGATQPGISNDDFLQGPLPLLWSVDFLPCSSHGIGWILSKVQANANLPELSSAMDLERLSTPNLTEVYRISDAVGEASVNAMTAADQAPNPSDDTARVAATAAESTGTSNGKKQLQFKEPEKWQHPWASLPDVAVAGSLQGSAFLRLLARSTAEESIMFNDHQNNDNGEKEETKEKVKLNSDNDAVWWKCPTLARVATFATSSGSDYLAEAQISVREANEMAEKVAASLASLRSKKPSMMSGMQPKGKWGRNIAKKPKHQSALQMAAIGSTIEEGVEDDAVHLQRDDFYDAKGESGEGPNDQGFITNSLRAIAMINAPVDHRSSDSVASHHRSSLKGPAVPKLFEELHSRDASTEKVPRRSKLSSAAAATLATHANLDYQGSYDYDSTSNSSNRNSAVYSPLPGASGDSGGYSSQSVWVASTSVRILRPYRGNNDAAATAAEMQEGMGKSMVDTSRTSRGEDGRRGANRSSITGGGGNNNSENGVAMAFVHVCRWPADGPLHVDYELTHSDSVAHYHGLALADANELNGQLLRPNPNLTAPLPPVLSVNADPDGDEFCHRSSNVNSSDSRGTQNESNPVAGLLGHRGTLSFQPGQSVAALPVVVGSDQPSLAAPFVLQGYPHKGGNGGGANRSTRSRLNAAAAGLALTSAEATTRERGEGAQLKNRKNSNSGSGSTALGAPMPAQDYLQLRFFHARKPRHGGAASLIEGLNTAVITAALPLAPTALRPLKKRFSSSNNTTTTVAGVGDIAGGRSRLNMAAMPSMSRPKHGLTAAGKVKGADKDLKGTSQLPGSESEAESDYGADSEYQAAVKRAQEENAEDEMEALQTEAAALREDARSLEEELWHGNSELHEFLNVMDLAPGDPTLQDVVRQLELKLEDLELSRVACLDAAADVDAACADLRAGKPKNERGGGGGGGREGLTSGDLDAHDELSSSLPLSAESTRHVAAQVVGFVASEFALPGLDDSRGMPPFVAVVLCRTDAVGNTPHGEDLQLSQAAAETAGTATPTSRVSDTTLVVDLAIDFRAFSSNNADLSDGRRRFSSSSSSSSSSTVANERSWRVYRSVTFLPGEEYVALTLPSYPDVSSSFAASSATDAGSGAAYNANALPFAIRCRLLSAHVYIDRPSADHSNFSSASSSMRYGHEAFQRESLGAVRFGEITEAKVVHVARKNSRDEDAAFDQNTMRRQQQRQQEQQNHDREEFSQHEEQQQQRHKSPAWGAERWSQDNGGGVGNGGESNEHITETGEFVGDDATPTITLAEEEQAALSRLADVQQQVAAAQETYVRVILEMGGALATVQSMNT